MVLLTLDTTIEDYMVFLTARTVEKGIDVNDPKCFHLTAMAYFQQLINDGLKTIRDIGKIPGTPYSTLWVIYALKDYGELMDEELVSANIKRITNPMSALRIYLDYDFLTDEDDVYLESMFKGKLPRAEKELAEGLVTRKKVS